MIRSEDITRGGWGSGGMRVRKRVQNREDDDDDR